MPEKPIRAEDVEARQGQTFYPDPFKQVVAGRTKRKLGDVFGLTNFGVNLTHLEPGAASALPLDAPYFIDSPLALRETGSGLYASSLPAAVRKANPRVGRTA